MGSYITSPARRNRTQKSPPSPNYSAWVINYHITSGFFVYGTAKIWHQAENFVPGQSERNKDRKNGKKLCTGNSRNINIRYFFAKDRVESNNISIAYCRTEHILTDLKKNPCTEPFLRNFVKWSWNGNTYISYRWDRPWPTRVLEMWLILDKKRNTIQCIDRRRRYGKENIVRIYITGSRYVTT